MEEEGWSSSVGVLSDLSQFSTAAPRPSSPTLVESAGDHDAAATSDDDSPPLSSCSSYSYNPADFPFACEIEEFRAPSFNSCTTSSSAPRTPITVVARSSHAVQVPSPRMQKLQDIAVVSGFLRLIKGTSSAANRRAAFTSEPQPAHQKHPHQQASASPRRATVAGPSSRRSPRTAATSSPISSARVRTATLTNTSSNRSTSSSSSSTSSTLSLTSIRSSLAYDNPVLYTPREIRKATNNFLAPRLSSSTASGSWRCSMLRGRDTVVFQRTLRGDPGAVRARLEDVCRGHHGSLVRLLGVSVGGSDVLFLVYEYVRGASLADCLRNARNPEFTLLPTWAHRMQVAADVAQGIEYVHHHSAARPAADVENTPPSPSADSAQASSNGSAEQARPRRRRPPVHNRIKSSSIIVTESDLRAKICHFGAAEITGELLGPEDEEALEQGTEMRPAVKTPRRLKIEGTSGYMAPELLAGSAPSQKSDVYAFGVVLLELLSGEEPLSYTYAGSDLTSVSLVDTARDVLGSDEARVPWDDNERRSRLRRWVDPRLKDSYPLDVVDKVLSVAVDCVAKDPMVRPDMERVAGKMSGLLLQSQQWAEKVKPPTDFSLSYAPR